MTCFLNLFAGGTSRQNLIQKYPETGNTLGNTQCIYGISEDTQCKDGVRRKHGKLILTLGKSRKGIVPSDGERIEKEWFSHWVKVVNHQSITLAIVDTLLFDWFSHWFSHWVKYGIPSVET